MHVKKPTDAWKETDRGSVAQIQEAYTQEECNVVVVADVDALKKV
jgi:hypothetical protein